MKKLLTVVFSASLLFCGLTVIKANDFSTSLSYHYSNGWRNGFTASISEYGGSPINYKSVDGTYNKYDSDSGSYTGFINFSVPARMGQFSQTITIGQGYSMGKVNCIFRAGGTIIDTKTITP